MLTYDYSNLLEATMGKAGVEPFLPAEEEIVSAVADLQQLADNERVTFPQLPEQNISPVLAMAEEDRERFTDVVVVGIGGSSLGSRALLSALRGTPGRPRIHVLENVDPHDVEPLLEQLDPRSTLVNVISKSGGTIETMANFLVLRRWLRDHLGERGYRDRVRATTDPQGGALRKLAEDEGLPTLDVPPGVGGRFSVLSAVGLYPLALHGVDVRALLEGAAAARDAALNPDPSRNPAALFAAHQVAGMRAGRGGVVFMPYATRLFETALWFVQLWAESLGKSTRGDGRIEPVGPAPIPAIGANDQHSQLQLFVEGPVDRSVLLLDVPAQRALCVPEIPAALGGLSHLAGRPLADILRAELRGVRAALTREGRPNATIALPDTGPRSMGGLLMFLQCATGIAGSLLDINPYDQPGVELAKRFAHTLLGQQVEAGLEDDLASAESGIGVIQLEPRAKDT